MSSSLPLNNALLPLRPPISKLPTTSTQTIADDNGPLDASRDARQIVRLAQCSQCSKPLREPVTLPCGNSLCKKCIPELHPRENITYPGTPNRSQGFICPFVECGADHAVGDCSGDVVLNKIMDMVRREVDRYKMTAEATGVLFKLEEVDNWAAAGVSSLRDKEIRTQVLSGGRLISTYTLAEKGELPYHSELTYTQMTPMVDDSAVLDNIVLERLKEAARVELDCQVCYSLFLDPFTTTCGHTFCRTCLHEMLNHSDLCPVCRRKQTIPPAVSAQDAPSNITLTKLLTSLCPEALAARTEAADTENRADEELDTPLFVCALSFPTVPTFLHVFEPRYRLMIKRAIESGDRKFGMLLHNPSREPQGDLGRVHFYQYGTLLNIVTAHFMADGRSLLETVGVSRFKVIKHSVKDDYAIGKVERVNDLSIAAEEAQEAREISSTSGSRRRLSAHALFAAPPDHISMQDQDQDQDKGIQVSELETMSTQELFELGVKFVQAMRGQSAPWLHSRVFSVYGECPDDPANFPWWLASVLPTAESEKYKLLSTNSVRERLKMCAMWIAASEAQRGNNGSGCTVL